ncbi:hypothetical protein GCM10008023_36400 [Sphingomonas glacialis]|uniref:Uncharacterized protein n=1 Tax=Sphingomonas glacialis TaxID=658225 RepID=A0ABQ3LTJ5_9SPHN|nr:hypothetical protein GCM10008023_36400 [Sphingomonas glacialis]
MDIFLLVPVGVRLFAHRTTRHDRLEAERGEREDRAEKGRPEKGKERATRASISQSTYKQRQCGTACQRAGKGCQQDREVERGGAKAQPGQLSRMTDSIACQAIDPVGNPSKPR